MELAESGLASSIQRKEGDSRPEQTALAGWSGREAPLDLIEEHLTDTSVPPLPEPGYRLVYQGGFPVKNWFAPTGGVVLGCNEYGGNYVSKLQPFNAGGWELVCRSLDLPKLGAMMEGRRRVGPRTRPETIDQDNIRKAAQRAKRKVRLLTKNMGATHMVTFTRRESEQADYWSVEEWAKAWDKFRRMIERYRPGFCYVAVLERHQKGNYHLHAAWVEAPGKKVNLSVVRGSWWACVGGRGHGNVDVRHFKVRAGLERADKVARYISKYTTKHFEEVGRFNKKRYWSSRQDIPEVRRYILNAATRDEALRAIAAAYGLSMSDYMVLGKRGPEWQGFFPFPDETGFWIAHIPDKHAGAPPPF